VFAIDTNVLVRLLVDDPSDPEQCVVAREFVALQQQVMIPESALLESVWVLQRLFGVTRINLKIVLGEMMRNSRYRFERPSVAMAAIDLFIETQLDFGDCLIHAACGAAATELMTFDKRLSKVPGARLLSLKGAT
jgi:predicted nucleic-acid-binding protein